MKSNLKQSENTSLIPAEIITRSILLVRGQKVLFDETLAHLYGVKTKALNQAVKRNIKRFPKDFMFQLTTKELKKLGVTICDFQFFSKDGFKTKALRLYRARCGHAFKRLKKRSGR